MTTAASFPGPGDSPPNSSSSGGTVETKTADDDSPSAPGVGLKTPDAEFALKSEPRPETTGATATGATATGATPASQATAMVKLVESADLWHAADGTAYATVEVRSWREHWPLRSRGFGHWLARRYYAARGAAPAAAAVTDALALLAARARFDGEEHQVFLRVAGREGRIYLDLADRQWRAVEIEADGWRVVERPPVRFRRARAVLALPEPMPGKPLTLLRRFINVGDDDWPLVAAWLIAAVRPTGPYPVLFLHGEQGSGKSTQARVLRALVDPNSAALRAQPKETHDLALAGHNGWVIALDNLSRLPVWLSDALCRLSTGGGFATRALYEHEEETIFDGQRPVLVTGIDDLARRSDLLDRGLVVHLPTIDPRSRRAESEFWREFEALRPWLVGALIEAARTALARLPSVALTELPRLADFAQWAEAAEPALGCEPGSFRRLYANHKRQLDLAALDSCPLAVPLLRLVRRGPWRGTASQLLALLEQIVDSSERRRGDWPKGLPQFTGLLRRLAPNLRAFGLLADFTREAGSGRRLIELRIADSRGNREENRSL